MLGCAKGKALKGTQGNWVHVTQSSGCVIGLYPEEKQTSRVCVTGGSC